MSTSGHSDAWLRRKSAYTGKTTEEILQEELGHKVRQMFEVLRTQDKNLLVSALGFAGECALLAGSTADGVPEIDRTVVLQMAREILLIEQGCFG